MNNNNKFGDNEMNDMLKKFIEKNKEEDDEDKKFIM